jgi:hypothetical protein
VTTHGVPKRLIAAALTLSLAGLSAPRALAGTHVVSQRAVVERLLAASKSREQKVRLFKDALATKDAETQARRMGLDPERLRSAVAHLSDKELADLEARARDAKDVRAGHSGNDSLAILGIVLLLAGVVLLVALADDDGYYDDDYCYCY